MNKTILFFLLFAMPACRFFEKEQMFSNDIDTLINKKLDNFITSKEYENELGKIRTEVDIKIDSLKKLYEENITLGSNKFYMIVGGFKVSQNANNYALKISQMGYPSKILFDERSQFNLVAARSYNNLRLALSEVGQFRENVTPGAWIYVKK
ncbi:MAG: hypothetical protein HC896_16160 [Bacteroidales bacterium]|nr:hypothetical protein [Bacteroidales bacterium]